MTDETIGTTENSRTKEQFLKMQQTVEQGQCPLCPPHTETEEWKKKILAKTRDKRWTLKPNDFPYENHSHHLVLIPKGHMGVLDLLPGDWGDIGDLVKQAFNTYFFRGFALVARFGLPEYNASTIRHFHLHIQVPDTELVVKRYPHVTSPTNPLNFWKAVSQNSKVISEKKYWLLTQLIIAPVYHSRYLRLFLKEHSGNPISFSTGEWIEMGRMIQTAITTFELPGGGFTLRLGDARFTEGMAGHTYVDIQVPDLTGPSRAILLGNEKTGIICKATFCKDRSPKEEERRKKRLEEFQK